MIKQEILEILEATATNRSRLMINPPANASVWDINHYAKLILKFLDELDDSLSVRDLVEALEDYR